MGNHGDRSTQPESPPVSTMGNRIWKYYSSWLQESFTCSQCGWRGTVGCQDLEIGGGAAIIECPKCCRSLGVVQFPTLRDTEEAAAKGNAEAIAALPGFQQRIKSNWELLERFAQEKLLSTDQLPELEGDALALIWDFDKGADGEYYQIIRLGDIELWRELAFFNNVRRYNEVKELLKQKYGARFQSLTPTSASMEWLTGDNFGVALRLSYT